MVRRGGSVSSVGFALAVAFVCVSGPGARAAVNQPPSIDPIPVQFGTEGEMVRVQVSAHDVDGDFLRFSAEGLPPGLSLDQTTGLIGGAPAVPGDSTVVVTVSDGWLTASTAFTVHVASAPSKVDDLVEFTPQYSAEGDRIDLDTQLLLNASLRDNPGRDDRPPVGIFDIENLPPGLRFSRKLGRIHGHVDRGAANGSPYIVTVTLYEGSRLFTAAFEWTVVAE
jgi:putative Ig domain-containing protein